jgi:pimeloyl-ACP methyl ester carboxylesterase
MESSCGLMDKKVYPQALLASDSHFAAGRTVTHSETIPSPCSSCPDAGSHRGVLSAPTLLVARTLHTAHGPSTPETMPMLVLTGEIASGDFLIQQGRLVATNAESVVVRNSDHWLMEEEPHQVMPELVDFLNR